MTKHIEEARKLEPCGWLVKPKGSAKVGTFFDHEPHFGNCENWDREDYEVEPLYDAAALAAAEERGRIEERDRLVEIVKRRMAVYQTKESASDFLQEPSNSNWDMYRYTREAHEWLLAAITKEPTP